MPWQLLYSMNFQRNWNLCRSFVGSFLLLAQFDLRNSHRNDDFFKEIATRVSRFCREIGFNKENHVSRHFFAENLFFRRYFYTSLFKEFLYEFLYVFLYVLNYFYTFYTFVHTFVYVFIHPWSCLYGFCTALYGFYMIFIRFVYCFYTFCIRFVYVF